MNAIKARESRNGRTALPMLGPAPAAQWDLGRSHFSFSALSTFRACPLRFYYRYILGLPEKTVAASLVYGAAFHSAVEAQYHALLAGEPPPHLDTLLAVFWDSWNARSDQQVLFGRGEDLNTIGRLADRMLRAFQRSAIAQPAGTIIAVEEELRGAVVPGCPELLARVDLIVDTGDALTVADFKTARSTWSQDHVLDAADQLLLYHELARPLAEGKPLRLAFALFTKTKFPELALYPVEVNVQRLERTRKIVERVWHAIEMENFYPAPSPIHCPRCPYREPCRAWTG